MEAGAKLTSVWVYKASINNNLYQVGWSVFHAFLLSLLPVYFYFEFGPESVVFAAFSVVIVYLLQLIPHSIFFSVTGG